MEALEHGRQALVEPALAQDAEVTLVRYHDDLQRSDGIGALLRF